MCKVKFYTKFCVPVDAFFLCKFTPTFEYNLHIECVAVEANFTQVFV